MVHCSSAFISSLGLSLSHKDLSKQGHFGSAHSTVYRRLPLSTAHKARWNMKVGIIYSTVTTNTERFAKMINEKMGDKETALADIDEVSIESLNEYEALIVGAPTLKSDSEDRRTGTPWDDFLEGDVSKVDLKGKPVAVFGQGDAEGYPDNFCDSIEQLHDKFQEQGAKMIGYTDVDSVDHRKSKAVRDGKFLGLALDVHTPYGESESRISNWCSQIISEGGL